MSKMHNIAGHYKFPYNLRELININNWLREFKWDRQRKQRGWSDRDSWNGGDHIAEVTSGILKKLSDEESHVDWPEFFNTNYPNNFGYKSLLEVAKDIDDYYIFHATRDYTDYTEKLGFEIKHDSKKLANGAYEYVSMNTPEEQKLITQAIHEFHKEEKEVFEKAKNAMNFVAANFPALWD